MNGFPIAFYLFVSLVCQSVTSSFLPSPIFHRLLRIKFKNTFVTIDEVCERDECYSIYDFLAYIDYRPTVFRVFGVGHAKKLAHSISALSFPKELTIEALDTRTWSLDPTFIEHDVYHMTICEAPFYSGTISRESSESKSLLMIGLGGANFNNYFSQKYHFFNITVVEISSLVASVARDWFSANCSEYGVVVMDGVEFVKQEDVNGNNYDVIVLDATNSDRNWEYVAPVQEFFEPDVIDKMARLLRSRGVLVINVVVGSLSTDELTSLDKLVRILKLSFKEVTVFSTKIFNAVFVCKQEPFPVDLYNKLPSPVPYYFF